MRTIRRRVIFIFVIAGRLCIYESNEDYEKFIPAGTNSRACALSPCGLLPRCEGGGGAGRHAEGTGRTPRDDVVEDDRGVVDSVLPDAEEAVGRGGNALSLGCKKRQPFVLQSSPNRQGVIWYLEISRSHSSFGGCLLEHLEAENTQVPARKAIQGSFDFFCPCEAVLSCL